MTTQRHFALIHLRLDVVEGVEAARAILREISSWGDILAISSVYKRFMTSNATDLSAYLEFVVRVETGLDVYETLSKLLMHCAAGANGIVQSPFADLTLLAFDDLIHMSPKLTLPYPYLHQDPLIIRCASEVWGQYEHPIFQKSLSDMSRLAPATTEIEFYLQGKTLVDF